MDRHKTIDELQAGLTDIAASPSDGGIVRAIVIRPAKGKRRDLETCEISLAGGAHGDAWAKGCWKSTLDGHPHPDVQICIMNARCIAQIAGERVNWSPAGDTFFIDLDLSPGNLPAGQRLALGTTIIEVTDTPHNGCALFTKRYGRDATVFVNGKEGRKLRLRGIYARVVQDGRVSVGDRVMKVATPIA